MKTIVGKAILAAESADESVRFLLNAPFTATVTGE